LEETWASLIRREPDERLREVVAAVRAAVVRAQEATRNVSQKVTQGSSWEELRSDIAQLTEIVCSHQVLLRDLIDRVAALEALLDRRGRQARAS
jgi:hypothetical protein